MKLTGTIKSLVQKDAVARLKKRHVDQRVNLDICEDVLAPGTILKAFALETTVKRDTAFVFADLAPNCNWAHPCEYHLYDSQTGKLYKTAKASFPPEVMMQQGVAIHAFHSPVKALDTHALLTRWKVHNAPLTNSLSAAPGQRYAILYAGRASNRHTNDLEFLYRTFVDVYGFIPGNIYVLNMDGTVNYYKADAPHPHCNEAIGPPAPTWPGDNTAFRMSVFDEGTRTGFQNAFNAIAGVIRPEDSLFIHTNNHGAGPGDGVSKYCMCTYKSGGGWDAYYVDDFIADLGVLPRFEVLMVMMEQCRSGGFINPIIDNSPATWTQVATAVKASDYSSGGTDFDHFARDWIAGITGHYPEITAQYPSGQGLKQTVDTNNDGRISAAEAFTYAEACKDQNDTPQSSDSPNGYGAYIFLGLPAHDLYLRDNLQDHGREPLIGGGISCSPDIIVFNQELLDPEAELGTPAAQQSDTLGSSVESGQDNFIYLRVQNRGTQPTSGTARLYWANPSVLPTPGSWTEITNPANPIAIPAVDPQEMTIVGPVVWKKADIPGKGHYCFVGLINSGDDPAPDPAQIHTVDDYYNFIRQSNNATWKNFNVLDIFTNSLTNMSFSVQGWPKIKLSADLMIDLSQLPSAMEVTLRILKRLSSSASLENAKLVEASRTYQKFQLIAGKQAFLRKMNLKTSDISQATLEIIVPQRIANGNYRLAVAELIDGKEMGRVTQMLAVGEYPYMGDRRTLEVHVANCEWAAKISRHNKEAYQDLERAWKHGYDGCHFCLPEYSKD